MSHDWFNPNGALAPTVTFRPTGRAEQAPARRTAVFDPQARIAELERRVAALERQQSTRIGEATIENTALSEERLAQLLAGARRAVDSNPLRVMGSPPRMHTGPCWGNRANGCSCFD